MFGATIRAAVSFTAGMLAATILNAIFGSALLPIIADHAGKNSQIYTQLSAINDNFAFVVLVAVVLAFIARGVVERGLGVR